MSEPPCNYCNGDHTEAVCMKKPQTPVFTNAAGEVSTSIDQPPPIPNDSPAVWDLVITDMRERDSVGRARYGTPLQANNGRDSVKDAYAEALDLVVYLRQTICEREQQAPLAAEAWALVERMAKRGSIVNKLHIPSAQDTFEDYEAARRLWAARQGKGEKE